MDIFSALAEPTRRTIVELLASSGPLSATEIAEQFPVSPPAISPAALFELEAWVRHMTHLWNQRFDALERVLEAEKKHIETTEMERRSTMAHQQTQSKEVTITRIFDAPRELVFKAWTDPKLVGQWWGPHGFTTPVCELDVRPGGAMRIDMRGPDGVVYPGKGVFHEIIEPDRLVFTTSTFEDAEGNPQLEVLNTVTFTELGSKTKLTLHAVVVKATPEVGTALAGMEEGWNQSLDRLAEDLAKA